MAKNTTHKIQLDPSKLLGFVTLSESATVGNKIGNKIGGKVGSKVGAKGSGPAAAR
jgi:hypothetical protein